MSIYSYSSSMSFPVSAQYISDSSSRSVAEEEALRLQRLFAINWDRNGFKIGPVFEDFDYWINFFNNNWIVSFSSNITASMSGYVEADTKEQALEIVQDLQTSGQISWRYKGNPIGLFTRRIDSIWVNEAEPFTTSISISVSPNPATTSDLVSIIAVLTSDFEPDGSVIFKNGTSTINISATQNFLSQTQSAFPAGAHSITAEFVGSSLFLPSTSAPVVLNVS